MPKWQLAHGSVGGFGMPMMAIGGIDIALWDIIGQTSKHAVIACLVHYYQPIQCIRRRALRWMALPSVGRRSQWLPPDAASRVCKIKWAASPTHPQPRSTVALPWLRHRVVSRRRQTGKGGWAALS